MSLSVGRNDTRLASYGRPGPVRVLDYAPSNGTKQRTKHVPGNQGCPQTMWGFGTVGDHSTGDQQKIVSIPRFYKDFAGMKKRASGIIRKPMGGVRGIRTLEPRNATNTLAGCPYRPLRHDSMRTVARNITIP